MKLSDAFEKKVSSPDLELNVLMLNINLGNNRDLMDKCKTLKEYCMFVDCIRQYTKDMEITEAVEKAVKECIQNAILAEFLAAQRAEVIAMSIFEYNEEEEMKKIRAAEYSVGWQAGVADGKAIGQAESVLELLDDLGEIPESLRDGILKETDVILLKKWLKEAAKAESIQMFLERIGLD